MPSARELLSFPASVDERAARLVAAGVVTIAVAAFAFRVPLLVALLALGFIARVASGPRFSPLALLVTRVVVPRLDGAPRPVPGPPKRFAQAIGAVFSTTALCSCSPARDRRLLGPRPARRRRIAGGVRRFCLGCWVFARLMRLGLIPQEICDRCVS